MRAAKRRVGAWLVGLVGLVASPALATATLPAPDTPLPALLARATVDALEAELAGDAAAPQQSPLPESESGFSLAPAPLGSAYGQLFDDEQRVVEPLPRFDVEEGFDVELPRLPETRVRAFALFDTPPRLPSNRVSDGSAAGFGLCLAATCDRPIQSFLSEDPLNGDANTPPSLHRYLYAFDQPTLFIDPDGKATLEVAGHKIWIPDFAVRLGIGALNVGIGMQAKASSDRAAIENAGSGWVPGPVRGAIERVKQASRDANDAVARMLVGYESGGQVGFQREQGAVVDEQLHKLREEMTAQARSIPGVATADQIGQAVLLHVQGRDAAAQRRVGAAIVQAGEDTAVVAVGAAAGGVLRGPRMAAMADEAAAMDIAAGQNAARAQATVTVESPSTPGVGSAGALDPPGVATDVPPGFQTQPARLRAPSVRNQNYPTRLRKARFQELGAQTPVDVEGNMRCQGPYCGGNVIEKGEGSPQHNPTLVKTHNEIGWNTDQPTRNQLFNDTATELRCLKCQKIEGGKTTERYRTDTGPNYQPRPKRNPNPDEPIDNQ